MLLDTLSLVRRRAMPFLLASRMIGLTSSTSLALVLQLRAPHLAAAETTTTQTIEPLSINDFLAATNTERVENGVAPLKLNPLLDDAALAKAVDMRDKNYWAHFRPSDGKSPWDFITEAGYNYTVAGENLARGFLSVNAITTAWMNSPAHRANLLSPKYTDIGFADVETTQSNGQPILLTVQMFGAR